MQNLHGLEQFEQRFFDFEARSIDDVSEWISRRHAAIRTTAFAAPTPKPLARFARAVMDDISFVSYRWNTSIEGQFLEDFPALFLGVPLSGHVEMEADGMGKVQSGLDHLRIYRRVAGHRNIGSRDYGNLSLIIPTDLLEERARSTYEDELSDPLHFAPLIEIKSTNGQLVLSMASYLVSQLASYPKTFDNPLIRTSIKEHLIALLLARWPHSYSGLSVPADHHYVSVWVKRAEDYMRAHCDQPITVQDIARHAGCSERTLQTAFKAYRNVTPMHALRAVRLEYAHNDILMDEGSVTDIALKWGFNHPARFARLYADRFGHKPSKARVRDP